MTNIISLNRSQLKQAIVENKYWQNGHSLLTVNTANWLTQNPYLEDSDICAIIGLENNQIIASIEIIPDQFLLETGTYTKKFWLKNWMVSKDFSSDNGSSSKIGSLLFFEAINKLDGQILVGTYTKITEKFYNNKRLFHELSNRTISTLFFKLPTNLLIKRKKQFKYLNPLVNFINLGIYNFYLFTTQLAHRKLNKSFQIIPIPEIDKEALDFIQERSKNDFTKKNEKYIKWKLDNIQFNFKNELDGPTEKIKSFKIKRDNVLIGLLSFAIDKYALEIKLFFAKDEESHRLCISALMQLFFKANAYYINTTNKNIVKSIEQNYKPFFTHQNEKKVVAYNNIKISNKTVILRDLDGR
jgi:hypothetical protein